MKEERAVDGNDSELIAVGYSVLDTVLVRQDPNKIILTKGLAQGLAYNFRLYNTLQYVTLLDGHSSI